MSNRTATQGTQPEASFVQRIAQSLRDALTGATPSDWFGPLTPTQPAVTSGCQLAIQRWVKTGRTRAA